MFAAIRISGQVNIPKKIEETLYRARLRKKYILVLLNQTPENEKLLLKIRNYIAYGPINKETLKELLEKRARLVDKKKKLDLAKVLENIEKKSLSSFNIKPFFALHPPRGGIDTKKHSGVSKKAVLGDNKEKINELIRRML